METPALRECNNKLPWRKLWLLCGHPPPSPVIQLRICARFVFCVCGRFTWKLNFLQSVLKERDNVCWRLGSNILPEGERKRPESMAVSNVLNSPMQITHGSSSSLWKPPQCICARCLSVVQNPSIVVVLFFFISVLLKHCFICLIMLPELTF